MAYPAPQRAPPWAGADRAPVVDLESATRRW